MTDLIRVDVEQGNGNGKSIDSDSDRVLCTADLIGCIAILIYDETNNKNYLIHSDSNSTSGKGSISLEDGINGLGLSKESSYKIGLIGGMAIESIKKKQDIIEKLIPNSKFVDIESASNSDTAYITGQGIMARNKRGLQEVMGLSDLQLITSVSRNRLSM